MRRNVLPEDEDLDLIDLEAVEDVTFESVDKAQMARDNWSSRYRLPLIVKIAGEDARLKPQPGSALQEWEEPLYQISLEVGGRPLDLLFPKAVLQRAFTSIDATLDLDSLDQEARTALIEYYAEDFLEYLEKVAATEIKVLAADDFEEEDVDPAFLFSFDHHILGDFPLGLECDRSLATRLRKVFDKQRAKAPTRRDIAVTIAFRIGHTTMDLSDLYDVGVGDGIVLDTCSYDENMIYAVVNEKLLGRCRIAENGPELMTHMLNKPKHAEARYIMDDELDDSVEPVEVGSLGELPVTLVFEVGRLEMPLSVLESLGEGHIFDLGKSQAHIVDIMTGGRVIGSGGIVRIGESFGVRVRHFARP